MQTLFQSVERNGHPQKKIQSFLLKYLPWFGIDSGSILAFLSTGEGSRYLTWSSHGQCYRDGYHLSCVLTPLLSSTNISRNNTRGFTCLFYMRFYQYFYVWVLKCPSSEIERQDIQEENTNLFLTSFSCNSLLWLLSIVLMGISRVYSAHFDAKGLSVLAQENWGGITLGRSNSRCNAQLCKKWWSISLYLRSPRLP